MIAGALVDIGLAPWIEGNALLEIGSRPLGRPAWLRDQGIESLLGGRIAADTEPVLVEGLFDGVDLCARRFDLRLAELAEILRPDIAGEQADDRHHHQQFKQGEAAASPA